MEPDDASADPPEAKTVEFDEVRLYGVVRKAVEDAILGVIGTLLLLGVAFVLIGIGFSTAARIGSPTGIAVGTVVVLFGLYLVAATLELIPSVWDWL